VSKTSAFAAVVAVCVVGASAGLRPDAQPPAIGVVDMAEVLSRYSKWQDMQKVLVQRREIRRREIEELAAEIDAIKEKLEKLESNSKEFLRMQAELIKKEALADATTQQYEIELSQSEEAQFDAVMKEISGVVKEMARELDRTVILQRALEVPDGIWESVLYAEPGADITDRLIGRLNTRYAREKK
jgi:Skp family chaperone for outer membrane proteins